MIYIILAVGALVAGIITAIAGGGGMLIMAILMMVDMPIKMIIGTNRVSALMDNGTSAYHYNKNGNVNRTFLKYAVIPAAAGTIVGTRMLAMMDGKILERLIPMILIALIIHSLTSKNVGIESKFQGFTKKTVAMGIGVTFLIGVYMGFFGMAAGSFFALALVYIFKFNFLEAVATVKPLVFLMGITSIFFYAAEGLIDYKYALFITFFRVIGSRFGSTYASKKGSKLVKPVFLTLCAAIVVKDAFY
ncbi:sulfite exporter TauE/SafE family protein [Ilyobacter sp.]|uniref:sulfite exporter TauE/SafE family protein n=1 Tax=Ilyobacter sp. TaxID=3100343 RepID=UPI00356379B4